MLFKGYNSALASSEMPLPDPVDTYVGGICFKSTLKNNRNIRCLFLNDYVSTPQAVSKWNRSVENILWKKVWTLPNRYLLVNKVKEISFKLIHQYYPVKTFIVSKFNLSIDVNCTWLATRDCPASFLALCSYKKTLARHLPVHCKIHT